MGEESEKHVKWRRKSILHLPHLSKHLPIPAPPLPVSARHCGLILSAAFQSWLHQERVAFQYSWPLSVDWCPWGIRQFKNSLLCASQKPRAICISSGTSTWWVTSILIMADTANSTCCCAAKQTAGLLLEQGAAQQPALSSPPCCVWAGLLQQRGLEKGTVWCCSECFQLPEKRIWSVSPAQGELWAEHEQGTAGEAWVLHLTEELELWDPSPIKGFFSAILPLAFHLHPLKSLSLLSRPLSEIA